MCSSSQAVAVADTAGVVVVPVDIFGRQLRPSLQVQPASQ
jgi:hypothetical protein